MTFKKTEVQKKATELLTSQKKHILLYGGSRSGKTLMFVRALIIRACKCSDSRHLVLRQSFAHIKSSLWHDTFPKTFSLCFPELRVKPHKQDYFLSFPNRSSIWFGGLDDKERTEKILGNEYSTIYFNEASQMKYNSIQIALTRLAQKNKLHNKAYYDCNPPGKLHWIYRSFIKGLRPEELEEDIPIDNFMNDYCSLLMNPHDNIENLDPDYIKMLENLPPDQKKRFLYGLFTDSHYGLIYKEFIDHPEITIVEPIKQNEKVIGCIIENKRILFQNYWLYYHGVDTGRNIGLVFMCVDENNNEYVFETHNLLDKLSEEVCKKVKAIQGDQKYLNVIDSASQVKAEYRKFGINYMDSNKDVLGAIEITRNKIKGRKLFVTSNCSSLINELYTRSWKESPDNLGRIFPVKENDHNCNALEYIQLTFLTHPIKIKPPGQIEYEKSLDFLTKRRSIKNWKDRG